MLLNIKDYILRYRLFTHNYPVLVACSGGRDSVFLVDVLHKLGYTFSIAHCNFMLRGEESCGDAEFVRLLAESYKVEFFLQNFNTTAYADKHKCSIQEAARALRYNWLEKIRKENGFSCIVIAHHADDQAETMLMHLAQGCGMKGIQGMSPRNQHIVRPLLSIGRTEIDAYIAASQLTYREDSSNAKDNYTRNYIRHHILPAMATVNAKAIENMAYAAELLQEANFLYEMALASIAKKAIKEFADYSIVYYKYYLRHPAAKTVNYALLIPYGVSAALAEEILKDLLRSVVNGAQYFTTTHRIIVERNHLCILPLADIENSNMIAFDKIPKKIHFGEYIIRISQKPIAKLNMKSTPRYAYFDADVLSLPLRIRYYDAGDYFYPIGMPKSHAHNKVGKKKVSKYFKDEKFSTLQKEKTPLLFSGDRLIWVVGFRMDDRCKISPSTKNVVQMQIIKNPEIL